MIHIDCPGVYTRCNQELKIPYFYFSMLSLMRCRNTTTNPDCCKPVACCRTARFIEGFLPFRYPSIHLTQTRREASTNISLGFVLISEDIPGKQKMGTSMFPGYIRTTHVCIEMCSVSISKVAKPTPTKHVDEDRRRKQVHNIVSAM